MATGNLWSPTADASKASPADFDLNHPVWMSEIMAAEHSALFVANTVLNKSVDFASGNKTAEFVVTGRIGTTKHQKGDELYGMDRKQIVRELGLNDRPDRTTLEDENLVRRFEQVDTRADIIPSMGHSLAARKEVEVMRRIVLAARHSNTSDTPSEFRQGGNWYVGASNNTGYTADFSANQTGALNVIKAIKEYSINASKLSVKSNRRFCFLQPELFYEVAALEYVNGSSTEKVMGGIYGNMDIAGPKQSFTEVFGVETPLRYMGVDIYMHNLIDAEYDSEVKALKADWTGDPDAAGNFSSTVGAIYQAEAVGHVDVMNTAFDVRTNVGRTYNDLISAMSWTGGGTLKPECALELVTS